MDEGLKKLIETTALETRRHFEVVAEGLETKLDGLGEGVGGANERIARLDARVERLASDIANDFEDVRSMIKFSHHELDRRLRTLEGRPGPRAERRHASRHHPKHPSTTSGVTPLIFGCP